MRIGLTGGIGTGKSTVARILTGCGALHIDADLVGHRMLEPESPVSAQVIEAFGREILDEQGRIDRSCLGPLVFGDRSNKRRLEAIIHPPMIREIERLADEAPAEQMVVIEAAILLETAMKDLVDVVWVTRCSRQSQLDRVKKRSGLSEEEIIRRIRSQMPLSRQIPLADEIIDTEKSKNETEKEVVRLYRQYQNRQNSLQDR